MPEVGLVAPPNHSLLCDLEPQILNFRLLSDPLYRLIAPRYLAHSAGALVQPLSLLCGCEDFGAAIVHLIRRK